MRERVERGLGQWLRGAFGTSDVVCPLVYGCILRTLAFRDGDVESCWLVVLTQSRARCGLTCNSENKAFVL